MGVQYGATQANVTLSGALGVPVPTSNQTIINIRGTGNGAMQDAYTVTAGKTFYLMGISIDAASSDIQVFKNDATTLIGYCLCGASEASKSICPMSPLWAYTSTQIVKVTATNTKTYHIWGIEQ